MRVPNPKKQRIPEVTWERVLKVFTAPENEQSTLSQIEADLSLNLSEFLQKNIVTSNKNPRDLEKNFLNFKVPNDPIFVSDQADFLLTKVLRQSVNVSSPKFIGHMTSALPYFMLPLSKIMIGLNQNTVKIETSKAFTPLENQVIGMMHHLIYERSTEFYQEFLHARDHALGVICSGGTIGNITGLWVARQKFFKKFGADIKATGLVAALKRTPFENLCVIVSKRAHYSFRKAIDLLGLGRDQLIQVDTDHFFKIDVEKLQAKLIECRKKKMGVLAIVGVAGTTETGTVDPLQELGKICLDNDIYFHVDAAWGGPVLFSERHKPKLSGIELADSVTIDAHKQMYCPMGAGLVLFKNPNDLNEIATTAQYVIREGSKDIGKHTLEGSKAGMAMMIHSGLQVFGRRGFELLINNGMEKAQEFAKLISANENFELISAPELNLSTYRYVPQKYREKLKNPNFCHDVNDLISKLTIEIQKEQRDHGKTFVSRTTIEVPRYDWQPLTVFRVVLANPLTTSAVFTEVLDEQIEIAERILDSAEGGI